MCIYAQDMKFLWSNLWLGWLFTDYDNNTGWWWCHTQTIHNCIGLFGKWANNLHRFGAKTHVLPVFKTENSPLKIYFMELHMEILMQQLLNNNQKICCCRSFFMSTNYFTKRRFLVTILQNDRPRRSLDGLYKVNVT